MKIFLVFSGAVVACKILPACKKADFTEKPKIILAGKEIPFADGKNERLFISHRGVNLNSTIAGENSPEAVRLAKRAGFELIETDVRWTRDTVLVAMHDKTLNRTCLNSDGTKLSAEIAVEDLTLKELKSRFILKADDMKNRTPVPTFKEFLAECKKNGLIPFIEPKLNGVPDKYYRKIIEEADEVMGRGHYVITSNNSANKIIRDLGFSDIVLMGILYLTTFEEIERLGNVIMAISATQFKPEEYESNVIRAGLADLPTESHANTFEQFNLVNNNGIDIISTDYLAPDLKDNADVIYDMGSAGRFYDHFNHAPVIGGLVVLSQNDSLSLKNEIPVTGYGGIYLEMELSGSCKVTLGNQIFYVSQPEQRICRHQLVVYNSLPQLKIKATDKCIIKNIRLKVTRF